MNLTYIYEFDIRHSKIEINSHPRPICRSSTMMNHCDKRKMRVVVVCFRNQLASVFQKRHRHHRHRRRHRVRKV